MGTPAALAWFMASMVCGITPSSAATKDYDVGRLRAPGPNCREGLVAGRVEERHVALVEMHVIGAYVLGYSARLAAHYVRLPYRVEERGLAVVDVAHDGYDRRPGLQLALCPLCAGLHPVFLAGRRGIDLGAVLLRYEHRGV